MSFAGALDFRDSKLSELSFLREVTWSLVSSRAWRRGGALLHTPTLELASVKLFNVVLLPLDGLPTNPIKGSRGIVYSCWRSVVS